MAFQGLLVGAIVGGCGVYAAWSLMPNVLQRALARQGLRLPLPRLLAAPLQRVFQTAGGCGSCGGCPSASAGPRSGVNTKSVPVAPSEAASDATPCKPLVFHPRKR